MSQQQGAPPPPPPPPPSDDGAGEATTPLPPLPPLRGESYEQRHVHGVYERIAPHFSATRHKPWPRVAAFLRARPPGAVGLDVGCGNGKYLGANPDVALLGSDRSAALVGLARERGWEHQQQQQQQQQAKSAGGGDGDGGAAAAVGCEALAVADGLALPFRVGGKGKGKGKGEGEDRGADFAICIAVLHHLSTKERRIEGVRALLECLRDDGEVLVYVWALEQGSSRRGWDEGADQDQLVPWVMKAKAKPKATKKGARDGREEPPVRDDEGGDKTYHRYYHLYKKGELEEDVVAAGGVVLDSGYDQDNWWAIAGRKTTLGS